MYVILDKRNCLIDMLVNIYVVMWLYIIVRLVEVNKFVRKDDDFFDLIFLVFCIV